MANKYLQHNISVIQYDDTKYSVNVYESALGTIEIVRKTDNAIIASFYSFCIHWQDITGITFAALATNYVKVTLP